MVRAVNQSLAMLSVSQEIYKWPGVGLTFGRYNYTGESDQLSSATARRRTLLGSSGPTYLVFLGSFSLPPNDSVPEPIGGAAVAQRCRGLFLWS